MCLGCKKDIYEYPFERNKRKYCSQECCKKHQKETGSCIKYYTLTCSNCSLIFSISGALFGRRRKSKNHFCSKGCENKWKTGRKNWWGYKIGNSLRGKPKSKEHAKKVGDSHRGVPLLKIRGANHPNWTGQASIMEIARKCLKNKEWKIRCLIRDNRMCVFCGENNNKKLEVDHIVPMIYILKKYHLKTLEEIENCAELWDISNGRTLCMSCHKKTDTYGHKAKLWTS